MLKVGSLAGGRLARFLSTSSYPPRPTNIVLRASPPASRILKVGIPQHLTSRPVCLSPSQSSFEYVRFNGGKLSIPTMMKVTVCSVLSDVTSFRPHNHHLDWIEPAHRIMFLSGFCIPTDIIFQDFTPKCEMPTSSAISFVVSRLSTGRAPSWYVGSRNLKAFGLSHSHDRISTKVLEVEFNNGETYSYSAEFLRVQSPSAEGKRPTARGEVRVVAGRRHVAILSVEPVGNYAIRVLFDDLHTTGIYTWNYLHSLGQQKFRVMREYLKALKQQGLSRDPLKKVASAASR